MTPYRGADTPVGSPGRCPRCPETILEPRTVGQVSLALCRSCRGIWIGEAAYLDAFFAADDDLARLARADREVTPSPVHTGDARCPTCGVVMEAHSGVAGVALDVCARHGFWLDAGELGVLLGGPEREETASLLDRLARWLIPDRRG
jgi:Zn-finger nucleic acid-binding protein